MDIAFGNNGDLTMTGIKQTTMILTIIGSGIKQTAMILTIIGSGGNSGTRELNNQEEIARYVCSRFWNVTKFMNVYDGLNLM